MKSYGMQLFETGFLKYANESKIGPLKSALIDSFDIYDDDNNKLVHVDAEELAEFSFEFFMPDINRIVAKRNYALDVIAAENYESSNEVLINGHRVQLYTKNELDDGTFWDAAPRNFFREVNSQLRTAQISESFYLLNGGNDLHVLLLTEEEQKIIVEKYMDSPKDTPYLP